MGFSKKRKFTAKWTRDRRGINHPSEGEANWTNGLYDREERGDIRELTIQPVYSIDLVNTAGELEHACKVKPDARFFDVIDNRWRILDFKGREGDTGEFRLKQKLMKICLGLEVELAGPSRAAANKKAASKEFERIAKAQAKAKKSAGASRS